MSEEQLIAEAILQLKQESDILKDYRTYALSFIDSLW